MTLCGPWNRTAVHFVFETEFFTSQPQWLNKYKNSTSIHSLSCHTNLSFSSLITTQSSHIYHFFVEMIFFACKRNGVCCKSNNSNNNNCNQCKTLNDAKNPVTQCKGSNQASSLLCRLHGIFQFLFIFPITEPVSDTPV